MASVVRLWVMGKCDIILEVTLCLPHSVCRPSLNLPLKPPAGPTGLDPIWTDGLTQRSL